MILGECMAVTGVYHSQAGIFADKIEDIGFFAWLKNPPSSGWLLPFTFLLTGLLLIAVARRRRRRIAPIPILFLFLLSGCDMGISIDVNQDGSGKVRTIINLESQKAQLITQMPNSSLIRDAMVRSFAKGGANLSFLEGADKMKTVIERSFCEPRNLALQSGKDGGWVRLQIDPGLLETRYRIIVRVDTREFYRESGALSRDSLVRQALFQSLSDFRITYHARLPGELIHHNAPETVDGAPFWLLTMNGNQVLYAESRICHPYRSQLWWMGLTISAMAFLIGLIQMIFSAKRRNS
jgi:hypothetical protein